ncbi:hypothetical protein [Alicyclobacillus shizuokensis]|uniref:hypothetical protein n=1 Tax=Alicyclobacillus shizuokensis TaxID=392014 RepID=UPI000AE030D5|nr:hypothetical protein [Alicyclobacillus shizuokensis]
MATNRTGRGKGSPRSSNPMGTVAQRRAVHRDPSTWTKEQREMVRAYLRAHPYDGSWADFQGRRESSKPRLRSTPLEQTRQSMREKLALLELKRDAGILTKREYERQYGAIKDLQVLTHKIYTAKKPKRRPGDTDAQYNARVARHLRDLKEWQKQASAAYNKLRTVGADWDPERGRYNPGRDLPPEKRLVMTPQERREFLRKEWMRDRYWEVFYHV